MNNRKWWQKACIYQIYPRSYKDTNKDGIGDLPGIISKLDYIQELGCEAIWISPFFKSPLADWGYDVSDYYSIAAEYGDLADFGELIQQAHDKNIRILLDLVMNHTSEQHPWFIESRSSRLNPKRDWYIWRDGRGSNPPNNWRSVVAGSGWNYDSETDQWYYASFMPFQPDLNYRNPAVKTAMFDVARFWFEKGVDGFRLDMFHALYKDALFRDNPPSMKLIPNLFTAGYFQEWRYNLNQPETIQLAKELRTLAESYQPEKLLIGEIFGSDASMRDFVGQDCDGLNLVFLWDLIDLELNASFLRNVIKKYEHLYPEPYTPVYVFGNHDRKRLYSRINQDHRMALLLALFQLTVRGVPVIYYGEEIGMEEVSIPANKAKDPISHRFRWVPNFMLDWLNIYPHRDGCRTPMQWEPGLNSGFCDRSASPWLPVHDNHDRVNVRVELEAPASLLSVYTMLLNLRKESAVIQEGSLQVIDTEGYKHQLLAYQRKQGSQKILVLINLSGKMTNFTNDTNCDRVIFHVGRFNMAESGKINIHPYTGLILSSE